MNDLLFSIDEIIKRKYVIPLYQRNFAWQEPEIKQLILDLYQSFLRGQDAYFIGSLIVMNRDEGDETLWEVIDGQQRLTVLSLILKYLSPKHELLRRPFLSYDSRDAVNAFLSKYYSLSGPINPEDTWLSRLTDLSIKDYVAAIYFTSTAPLNTTGVQRLLGSLSDVEKSSFASYILEHVMMVFVDMPVDTDVASYFEIMNNRGAQLQKHEVLKSLMMGRIAQLAIGDEEAARSRSIFSHIWDACADMDHMVQRNLCPKEARTAIFGGEGNYDAFFPENLVVLANDVSEERSGLTIDAILSSSAKASETISEEEVSEEMGGQKAIIDFPNFLLHVFRLLYNKKYREIKRLEYDETAAIPQLEDDFDIPLHEKELLNVYNSLRDIVDPLEFAKQLLYYRIVFDRYIVKTVDISSNDSNANEEADEDELKWTLHKPSKREDRRRNYQYVGFRDTFEGEIQDKVIKALSMLQVTYRQRRYKNYLNRILSWFTYGKVDYSGEWYLDKLNRLILNEFENNPTYAPLRDCIPFDDDSLMMGTQTPHFLFNFIDYLYWSAWKEHREKDFVELKYLERDFTYRYFNSVEHHLPQSFSDKHDIKYIHSLGNLCLISKSMNSRLNSESPKGKAAKGGSGKYYRDDLPPTRKIIYDITNECGDWTDTQIKEHYDNLIVLLKNRASILGIDRVNPEDIDIIRAMLCSFDLRYDWSWCSMGNRCTVKIDQTNELQQQALSDIKQWKVSHPLLGNEDYISEQLSDNSAIKTTSWRYFLAKYPEFLRYCQDRRIAFSDDEYVVTLIEKKKIVNCYRDLLTWVVSKELANNGIESKVWTDHGSIDVSGGYHIDFYHNDERVWFYRIQNNDLSVISTQDIGKLEYDPANNCYIHKEHPFILNANELDAFTEVEKVVKEICGLYHLIVQEFTAQNMSLQ